MKTKWTGESSKLQIPSSKEAPSSKFQALTGVACSEASRAPRHLEFGIWNFFGTWSLGFGILIVLLSLTTPTAHAATTINLATNVLVPQVKRFGINLGYNNYFDSGQMLKELIFVNPGFEGLQYQSEVRLGAGGTTTSGIEDQPFTQWPSGFWDGASYEFIYGAAKGRTGMVAHSLAPNRANPPSDPAGSAQGTTYQFAETGTVPGNGDYLILRKVFPGGAATGWSLTTNGNPRVDTEFADLPPGTQGRQCIRLTATNSGDFLRLSAANDTLGTFVLLNGRFRLSFKAKGVGGANRLQVAVLRGANTFLNTNLVLTTGWQTYQLDFNAAEPPTVTGSFATQFTPVNQSAVLLDDVSLRQTDGDPGNPTPWRDAVVNALRALQPGIIRGSTFNWTDSVANHTAPSFARMRAAYTSYATNENKLVYSLDEHFALCEHVGAEPWYIVPVSVSTAEMLALIEYLAGPTNTVWGARRAANGRVAPWTAAFPRIHLEFGNECWNPVFRGGAIEIAQAYAARGSELFGVAKTSPHYDTAKFNLILGGQATFTARNSQIHTNSANHDSFSVAPYIGYQVDNFANHEELFGSLFAETEMNSRSPYATNGFMRENFRIASTTGRRVPLNIYEVNLHTTEGAIDQPTLDNFTSSTGAGLAVADHMLLMLRELECRDQCLFSLAGWRYSRSDGKAVNLWSVVKDLGVTDRKRPQYLAVKLANEALAGDLLATTHTGDDPTWNVSNLNRVNYNGAHHLRSYATASGTNRSLIVFNLHRTSALDVNFTGSNAPSGTVTLKRLTSANITDHNESAQVIATTTNILSGFNPAANFSLPPFSMNVFQWSTAAPVTAPTITSPPQSRVVIAGTNVTLSATVTGSLPLTCQWQHNNQNLPGATSPTLTLLNVSRTNTGTYVLQVSNPGGATASQPATLRVLNFPRLQPPQPLPGGGLRLRFNDHDDGALTLGDTPNFEVWVSTNLLSTNWVRLNLPLTVLNGWLTFDDVDAANHRHRFYQVIER